MKKNFVDNTIIFKEQNVYIHKKNIIENNVKDFQDKNLYNYSSNTECSEIKNIFKNDTPLTLEPSLYSPLHHLGGERKEN